MWHSKRHGFSFLQRHILKFRTTNIGPFLVSFVDAQLVKWESSHIKFFLFKNSSLFGLFFQADTCTFPHDLETIGKGIGDVLTKGIGNQFIINMSQTFKCRLVIRIIDQPVERTLMRSVSDVLYIQSALLDVCYGRDRDGPKIGHSSRSRCPELN